ncbi:biopolymer transporter ExbD [Paracrocinitomix mangrovi]|uniref:ExbD/TolR family protein n=1 Tax=Paracrocinitomix mangrovi TaxID=2862509 RepID=UPI001C8E7ACE|nr:biopolymer transporter ExbD [Paracrocinitomix mangrovi]UKN00687.1 biopolymer transporter ExbD [Paracrocinitomix mangrovi]
MGKFNKGGKKDVPGVNTSALPDIIFMLLFFFMVATTMKEVEYQVEIKKPKATQAEELEDKDNVDFIYIGFPLDKEMGSEPRIQLDDQLISDVNVVSDWKQGKTREGKRPFDIVTSLKVHKDVGMRIVSDVKEELTSINAIKINYSADKEAKK